MPVLLCFHGQGSNKKIYEIQTARLRAQLGDTYEYVYLEAPIVGSPGAGMLPTFASAGPFYNWASISDRNRSQEIAKIHENVREIVEAVRAGRVSGIKGREVNGILAFSQGALVSVMLLLQQKVGQLPWFPQIRFGVFVCSDYVDFLDAFAEKLSQDRQDGGGGGRILLDLPSIHLHGTVDPHRPKSRKMLERQFSRPRSKLLLFNGSHQFPSMLDDCKKAADLIRAAEREAISSDSESLLEHSTS